MKIFVCYYGTNKLITKGDTIGSVILELKHREKMDGETKAEIEDFIKKDNNFSNAVMVNYRIIEA